MAFPRLVVQKLDAPNLPSHSSTLYSLHLELIFIVICLLSTIAQFATCKEFEPKVQSFYSLWVFPTPISDFGFSFSGDMGRVNLENKFINEGIDAWTYYISGVSAEDCYDEVTTELRKGLNGARYQIIYVLGQQFIGCLLQIESNPEFSDVKFVHFAGSLPTPKISLGIPKMFQARFLHGMLCAQATKTKKIGYIASMPYDNTVVSRAINAFALGAKMINPEVTSYVGITGVFLDPVPEQKATQILIDLGVDCLAQQQNDLTVHYTAAPQDVYTLGYATDARYFAGESVLSSALYNWLPIAELFARQILNGTWDPYAIANLGFETDTVSLSGYSIRIQPEWRLPIDEMIQNFVAGLFEPFCTPLFDDPKYLTPENSVVVGPNVTCLSSSALVNMTGISRDSIIAIEYNSTHSAYETVYIRWTSPGAIVLIVISGVLLIMTAVSVIDILINRAAPGYRTSSPLFLLLILLGIIIGSIAPFFWIGLRNKYNCMVIWWLIGIAHALIYSCLLAKNWRIWKIFSSGHFKVMAIMNIDLLSKWVAIILGLEIILLSLWTAFDPQLPKISGSTDLRTDQLQLLCASKTGNSIGLGIFLAYNVALLIPAALISYWTRIAKEYRESHSIALIVYSTLVIIFIVIGINIGLPNNYLISFFLGAYGSLATVAVCYVTLFLPKLWRVHRGQTERTAESTGMQLSTLKSQPAFESVLYSRRSRNGTRNNTPTGGSLGQDVVENPSRDADRAATAR